MADGTIIIRDKDNQKQDVANLSRDTEHANDSISPIFDKEKEQNRLKEIGMISDIGGQVADIARTQGELSALKAAQDKYGPVPADATEEQRQAYLAKLRDTPEYKKEQEKYGTGSDIQRGIQAATAALQGLAGGNLAGALAGASAPELAHLLKSTEDNPAVNAIAHAILGGAVAALQGNSAAAGAIGAGGGELAARAIANMLYPNVDKLSEEQKQTVSALASISAGMAGGIATGNTVGAATGAGAGKNAVENNYLSRDEAAEKASLEYKLKNGLLSGDDKAKAEARLGQLDETDKARDAAIAAACPPGSKSSGACGTLVGPAQKALAEYGENVTYSLLYKDLYPQDAKNLETVLQGLDAGSITRDQAITAIAQASGVSWEIVAGRYDTAMQLQAVTAALAGLYGANSLNRAGKANASEVTPQGYNIDPKKFDYFFGKVTTGSPHNIERSAQNLKDLNTLGINNEQSLMNLFNKAASDGVVISQKSNNFGTTVTKSISVSDKGAVQVSFFYPDGNMSATPKITTLIPKISSKNK